MFQVGVVVEVLLVLDNQPCTFFLPETSIVVSMAVCWVPLPLTSKRTVKPEDKALEDGAEAAALCRHWV